MPVRSRPGQPELLKKQGRGDEYVIAPNLEAVKVGEQQVETTKKGCGR